MFIYILKLEHGKYYVGRTNNVKSRIQQHKNQSGSSWTTLHKFKSIVNQFETNDPYDEDKWTKKYMQQYGIDNVRGGSYTTQILDDLTIKFIEREIRGATNCCFTCGGAHFVTECKSYQTDNQIQPILFKPKFGKVRSNNDPDERKFNCAIYKMVADNIRARHPKTKKVTNIYSPSVKRVTHILSGCNEDQSLTGLRTKLQLYIQNEYKVNTDNLYEELFQYISDHELFQYLKDCSEEWINKIVYHIHKSYESCENHKGFDKYPWDMDTLINDSSLYFGLTNEHATCILDIIDQIRTDCELHDPNTELGRDFAITCETD